MANLSSARAPRMLVLVGCALLICEAPPVSDESTPVATSQLPGVDRRRRTCTERWVQARPKRGTVLRAGHKSRGRPCGHLATAESALDVSRVHPIGPAARSSTILEHRSK